MKNKIINTRLFAANIFAHPLFSGSAVMIVGTNIANVIAYFYHLVLGRIMGPSEYGELASIISLLGMFMVSFAFLGTVIVKFISSSEEKDVETLFSWFFKKAIIYGLIIGVVIFSFSKPISTFLHVDRSIIALLGPIIFISFLSLVFRSFLQGQMRFFKVAVLANSDMVGRLILGVALVIYGWSVYGAVAGILAATMITFILGKFFTGNYKIFKIKSSINNGKKVLSYAVPIFFASFAINSFFSSDLILVKHFFAPKDAGIYASLSTLGKIIFFAASPVAAVMFPMVSKRQSKGHSYRKIFIFSLLITFFISLAVLTMYLLFPKFLIRIFYGSEFLGAADYLFSMGVFMAIFTMSSLIVNFYLSQGKTKVVIFVVIAALIQVVGIWFYHESIREVIRISITAASLLLASLLLYFGYETKKNGSF